VLKNAGYGLYGREGWSVGKGWNFGKISPKNFEICIFFASFVEKLNDRSASGMEGCL